MIQLRPVELKTKCVVRASGEVFVYLILETDWPCSGNTLAFNLPGTGTTRALKALLFARNLINPGSTLPTSLMPSPVLRAFYSETGSHRSALASLAL